MNEDIYEKVGELKAIAKAAHARIDTLNVEVKASLDSMNKKTDEILKQLHTDQGSKKTWVWLAGVVAALIGGGFGRLVEHLLGK